MISKTHKLLKTDELKTRGLQLTVGNN